MTTTASTLIIPKIVCALLNDRDQIVKHKQFSDCVATFSTLRLIIQSRFGVDEKTHCVQYRTVCDDREIWCDIDGDADLAEAVKSNRDEVYLRCKVIPLASNQDDEILFQPNTTKAPIGTYSLFHRDLMNAVGSSSQVSRRSSAVPTSPMATIESNEEDVIEYSPEEPEQATPKSISASASNTSLSSMMYTPPHLRRSGASVPPSSAESDASFSSRASSQGGGGGTDEDPVTAAKRWKTSKCNFFHGINRPGNPLLVGRVKCRHGVQCKFIHDETPQWLDEQRNARIQDAMRQRA